MSYIKIFDSVSVAFGWFTFCIIMCKFFKHKKHTTVLAYALMPVFFTIHFVTHLYDNLDNMTYTRMIMQQVLVLLMFLFLALFIFECFSLTIGEKLTLFGIHIATTLISEILLSYLMIHLVPNAELLWNAPNNVRIIVDIIYLIINFIFSISALYLFKKYIIRLPLKINLMILIIAVNVIGLFMLAVNPVPATADSNAYIYNTTIALICAALLVVFIILIIKFMIAQERRNEEFTWMKNIQNTKIEHYSDIQNKIKEQRKIQHDFKDNIAILKVLVDSGDDSKIHKASEMMSAILDQAESARIVTYTNNEIANAVLSSKITEAKDKGITVEAHIELPNEIGGIDDYDLNLLFINLLSNAIEACENELVNSKLIRIFTRIGANHLIIKVTNTYNTLHYDNKGKLVTSKNDKKNHGIGLQIIDSIVKKYNGSDDITTTQNEFTHIVSLDIDADVHARE